ncbi:aminotransferase class V-fold PLP-dependent enzyme [Mesorhizobium sp. M0244]|uniref:aminotransferase class V-fold PLP-dependent enzyme n=1 Tax=Mesorhizobium sp. M0244 TaxID=2956926 RepID=UPI00333C52CF
MSDDKRIELAVRGLRGSFPGAAKWTYLDVAGRGLLSTEARSALDQHLDSRMMDGGDKAMMLSTVELARQRFALLVNVDPSEIAMVKNVSDGINAVASSLPWKEGDNVVLCGEVEHPSNIFPWYNLRDKFGVEVRSIRSSNGVVDPLALFDAVDENTKLVTVASVSFAPGYRADLESIGGFCRDRSILFLVDAAQTVGVLHLDLKQTRIDALSVSTSKGLLGLYGMGFLFVRRQWAERMRPAYLSRFGVDLGGAHEATSSDGTYSLQAAARRFDVGNYNYLGCVAAATSIGQLLEIGSRAIESHVLRLSSQLAHGLLGLDLPVYGGEHGPNSAHIVCVGDTLSDQHDSTSQAGLQELFAYLMAHDVKLSIRRGILRFSFHVYNDESDVDRTLGLVKAWLDEHSIGRPRFRKNLG